MSTYKVPQDVEAEDKLIGPFSFRQFIYLLITAGTGALAYFLGSILLPLSFLIAPISLFFLILALPLRKEQSMEIYLGAILQFYFRPRKKIWESDGLESLVEFTDIIEEKDNISLKTLSTEQAVEQISFLSNLTDSEGWLIKGINTNPEKNNSHAFLQESVINEVNQITDPQDNIIINNSFNTKIDNNNQQFRENIINSMNQSSTNTPISEAPIFTIPTPPAPIITNTQSTVNDFQTISQDTPLNSGIMNLIANEQLSVESIAQEANRLKEREDRAKDVLGGQDQLEIRFRQ